MEAYSYQKEIRRCLIHFISALDGGKIYRTDIDGTVRSIIQANYLLHPKTPMYKDLITDSDQIRLPSVIASLNGINLNLNRNLAKTQEYLIPDTKNRGNVTVSLPPPTPVDLNIHVKIVTEYYDDILQLMTNFMAYSNPYIVISMVEPWSNQQIQSQIIWDGSISMETPEETQINEVHQRYVASTNFTFQTWIFKAQETVTKNICRINQNYHTTNQYFDFDDIKNETPELIVTTGYPTIKYIKPFTTPLGKVNDFVMIVDEPSYVTGLFLSGSTENMFEGTSAYNLFPDSTLYPQFNGISIPFTKIENSLIFEIPQPQTIGYFDILITTNCAYNQLKTANGYWAISANECNTNTFFTHSSSCCPTYINTVFESGIEVVRTYSEECSISPCNSAYTPPINNC